MSFIIRHKARDTEALRQKADDAWSEGRREIAYSPAPARQPEPHIRDALDRAFAEINRAFAPKVAS